MPPSSTKNSADAGAAKRSPKPKKGSDPDDMAQITLAVGGMKIEKDICWYGLDVVEQFKMWRFTSQNSYCITVQFISVPYPEDYFKAEISPDGNTLMYSPAVPGWYGTNKHLIVKHSGKQLFDKDCSKSTANLKTSQIIKKTKTVTGNKLYWGEPFAVNIPEACEPNVSLSFAYHSTGQRIQDGAHIDHVQFMLMVTCHLTCIQKMLLNNKKPKAAVNKTHEFDKLFGDSDDEDEDEDGFGGNGDTSNDMVENQKKNQFSFHRGDHSIE